MSGAEPAVTFERVDVIFATTPAQRQAALARLDAGVDRQGILEETGAVVGACSADLTVREGELCVLMGLSGSGKSTLLRCVNGLNAVTRGRALVADRAGGAATDLASCDARSLRALRRNRVAMVFQQFALLPWRTVAENVAFGLELRRTPRRERARVVEEMLTLVQLDGWADKYAHELSGGMQQRVGLARAFATDADILLMDEPFSALDPLIRDRLQDELLALQSRLKKTILFVSHDLDEALKLGNHIAIMEGGRIIQYGAPEEIVLNPADDYVTAFVSHVNPLNVLRGRTLMRPLAVLPRTDDGWVTLDPLDRLRAWTDGDGRLTEVRLDGAAIRPLVCGEACAVAEVRPDHVVAVAPDVPIRRAIALRHESDWPLLMVEGDRLAGIVDDADIYRGIMGRHRART